MRTRAALIGARLRIEPNPAGRGTRVVVEVDRAASADAASVRGPARLGEPALAEGR